MHRGEEDENPTIKLEITIECLSLEDVKAATVTNKGKKKKSGKWDHFWSNTLTVLVVRSDGVLVTNCSMS